MRKLYFPLPLLIAFLVALLPLCAKAAPPLPSPPSIAASGFLLIDYDSGQILAENNADARLEPASLTKIMTAYTVFRELADNHVGLGD